MEVDQPGKQAGAGIARGVDPDARCYSPPDDDGPVFDAAFGRMRTRKFHELGEAEPALLYRIVASFGQLGRREYIQEPFSARVERHGCSG